MIKEELKKLRNWIYVKKFEMTVKVKKNEEMEYCNICGKKVLFCQKAGLRNEGTKKYSIIGMGVRKKVICPYCRSIDRFRWLYWVLCNAEQKILKEEGKILHFAPEKCIADKIKERNLKKYITGDIQKKVADYVIDIKNIPYEDNYFDCVIASMVLEHIKDEKRAINELKRVCKKNGYVVLTVPVGRGLKQTIEEKEKTVSKKEKVMLYGQKDHVRLYGEDTKERLENYQFEVIMYQPCKILKSEDIKKMKLIKEDIVFVCKNLK